MVREGGSFHQWLCTDLPPDLMGVVSQQIGHVLRHLHLKTINDTVTHTGHIQPSFCVYLMLID